MSELYFTNEQKWAEAEREVSYRRFVYPRMVAQKKLKQDSADMRIAIMQEIAEEYRALASKEQLL